jgi:hypothetical protein
MKITGKNAAVTAEEDIIAAGGTFTEPTAARVHAIVSGSANDTAAGTGARIVDVYGIGSDGLALSEGVTLNGATPVNTTKSYLFINEMKVRTAGSGGVNAGIITATAATDSTVTCTIPVGYNISKQAAYMAPAGLNKRIEYFNASTVNATGGAVTTLIFKTKAYGGVWMKIAEVELLTGETFQDIDTGYFPEIGPRQMFKVSATVSAGSSSVNINFDIV